MVRGAFIGRRAVISLAHLKTRLGQYAAVWLGGFLLAGVGILTGSVFADLMDATDMVLPLALLATGLALGLGVIATLLSRQTLGTKLMIFLLAIMLLLPLLWAPVSAAVVIAFFADRSIEYSGVYAAFQIGVSRLLFPVAQWFGEGDVIGSVWSAFQVLASVVGFLSAMVKLWPSIRRVLGPEPAET
jgi:hypothetical protein